MLNQAHFSPEKRIFFSFAEDILKSGHAVWVAPDGAGIVYATFNDSEVEEVQFEVYGQGEGDDAYPGVSSIRYPKVGGGYVMR